MSNNNSSSYVSGDISITTYYVTQDPITTNKAHLCAANNSYFTIAFIPFKVIVAFMNLFLFTAAAKDREKLQRQNYTFICVMSTLLSNTVYLLMSIWLTVDNYSQSEANPQEDEMTLEKYVWIFSEAVTASMVLSICANVTSLIYVTLDSVFYVGRSGTEWGGRLGRREDNAKRLKIRVTQILVVASWMMPVIMTAITFGWNCAKICRCPSNNFEGEHCPQNQGCSHMWAPMKVNFLWVVMVIWALEIFGLVIFVVNGIRRQLRTAEAPPPVNIEEKIGDCEVIGDVRIMTTPTNEPEVENTKSNTLRRMLTPKKRFNSKFKFATALTVLLFLCTSPLIVGTIIDSYTENPPYSELILGAGIFMFIYCALCPVLMWKFLPSLRSSTHKLIMCLKTCSCVTSRDKRKGMPVSSP